MTEIATDETILDDIRKAFGKAGIALTAATIRRFPGEVIAVVEVGAADYASALEVAAKLDQAIESGFVTVRKSTVSQAPATGRAQSLVDPRVNDLIEILNARSRTSEQQPSLRYIKDASETLNVAMSRRHHLIFGRRGVGKTALMLEAKRSLEARGAITFWMNIQAMRALSGSEAFLTVSSRLCDLPESLTQKLMPGVRGV